MVKNQLSLMNSVHYIMHIMDHGF